MEQRDFILQEIEKIGKIINAFRQKLSGDNENIAIAVDRQVEDLKGKLLKEVNFDLDHFIALNLEAGNEYILSFNAFSLGNIELLADYLYQICLSSTSERSCTHSAKALQLYTLSSLKSDTYSIEREYRINELRNKL